MIQEFHQQILRLERELNELTADNGVMRSALEEISLLGMNKPFPLDGFGEVADAIAQAKYDTGEIARAALLKAKQKTSDMK